MRAKRASAACLVTDDGLSRLTPTHEKADAPMSTREPIFNVPNSVLAVLGVICVVFAVETLLPDETRMVFLVAMSFIPARYAPGAPVLPGDPIADVTSFVTYMFLHGNMTHLMLNGVWLLAFGSAVAKRIGNMRFLLFSCLCGIAGALAHLVLHFGELTPVIGASAAISGQMAGAVRFIFASSNRGIGFGRDMSSGPLSSLRETFTDPRILIFLVVWAALNAAFGLGYVAMTGEDQGVAWEAHIGGFAFGLLTFGFFDRNRPREGRAQPLAGWGP